MGLKEARDKRDEARKLLAAGIDSGEAGKAQKTAEADSIEALARAWLAKHTPRWAPGHASKIIGRLERDIFPWLGGRPVGQIATPELLAALTLHRGPRDRRGSAPGASDLRARVTVTAFGRWRLPC